MGRDFKTFSGGKGANQAVACARAAGAQAGGQFECAVPAGQPWAGGVAPGWAETLGPDLACCVHGNPEAATVPPFGGFVATATDGSGKPDSKGHANSGSVDLTQMSVVNLCGRPGRSLGYVNSMK